MKLLFALIIGILGFALNANAMCSKGIDQTIYNDQLGYTVADWSWAKPRNFSCTSPVHSGSHSIAFTPKTYDGLYFNLQNPIDPSMISFISLWVHGNKGGNQRVIIRFTLNKVASSHDFFLWGDESCIANSTSGSIKANTWSQAIINCDHLDPGQYDGIQILSFDDSVQETMFIDDIEVHKRCDNSPYRNIKKPEVCKENDCVSVSIKEGEKNWIQNGFEYQQYVVSMKNNYTKPVTILEFNGGWFKPRDAKDIWNVSYLEGGYYGLPDHIKMIYPGESYEFGCVSVKGPVSFKVTYVEYENEKKVITKPSTAAPSKPTAKPSTAAPSKPTTKPSTAAPSKPTVKPSTAPKSPAKRG